MHRGTVTSLQMGTRVLLLLLLFVIASVALANEEHRCIHDNIVGLSGSPRPHVVRELQQPVQHDVVFSKNKPTTISAKETTGKLKKEEKEKTSTQAKDVPWFLLTTPNKDDTEPHPVRVRFFAQDLEEKGPFCTTPNTQQSNLLGENVDCGARDILTAVKKDILLTRIIPRAIELHSERLSITSQSHAFVVPAFTTGVCSMFNVHPNHSKTGVANADLVMYVAAAPTRSPTMAWTLTCAALSNGRPVVGAMNFGPKNIRDTAYAVRVAAHELTHVLGFTYSNLREQGMIYSAVLERKKWNFRSVNSPTVRAKVAEHFNCDLPQGMELENEDGQGNKERSTNGERSHWERRLAKDELMSPIVGVGFYSALTLAVFADTGFYSVNWNKAETMKWGAKSNCDLFLKKCVVKNKTLYPDMFCTTKSENLHCTSDRRALGTCPITDHGKTLSLPHIYFTTFTIFAPAEALTDYCPVITPNLFTWCSNTKATKLMPGSRLGPASWCATGDGLQMQNRSIGDVCVDVRCKDKNEFSVRYLGNDAWHTCQDGAVITPIGNESPFTAGKIICPNHSEVCTVMPTSDPLDNGDPEPQITLPQTTATKKTQSTTSPAPQLSPSAPLIPSTTLNETTMAKDCAKPLSRYSLLLFVTTLAMILRLI